MSAAARLKPAANRAAGGPAHFHAIWGRRTKELTAALPSPPRRSRLPKASRSFPGRVPNRRGLGLFYPQSLKSSKPWRVSLCLMRRRPAFFIRNSPAAGVQGERASLEDAKRISGSQLFKAFILDLRFFRFIHSILQKKSLGRKWSPAYKDLILKKLVNYLTSLRRNFYALTHSRA